MTDFKCLAPVTLEVSECSVWCVVRKTEIWNDNQLCFPAFTVCTTETLASFLKYDVKYRVFLPGKWMPSKLAPGAQHTWSEQSISEIRNFKMLASDILLVTYLL